MISDVLLQFFLERDEREAESYRLPARKASYSLSMSVVQGYFTKHAIEEQCFPHSVVLVDTDPDCAGKNYPQKKKKWKKSMFCRAGCSIWRARGLFCSLQVLKRG